MARRLAITVAVLTTALAGGLLPGTAQAQEIEVSGPLAGSPAVIGLRIYREMRFQIQLHSTITLEDEYSRSVLGGAQLQFHPTDWLGIGVWGGFSFLKIDTSLTDEVRGKGQTNDLNVLSLPNAENFDKQIGRMLWVAAPQVSFIPLRGKLGIFEKLFVDTDFYVFGGVGFVGLEERSDIPKDQFDACRNMGASGGGLGATIRCLEPTQDDLTSRMTIAPTFGAGLSLYMGDWVAMTLEWRALPFAWNTSGTDESGDPRGDFPNEAIDSDDQLSHFNYMMSLGFAFYLPAEPELSHMD